MRELVGSYGNSIFSFLRNLHTVFHSGFTNLPSYQNVGGFSFLHILSNMWKSTSTMAFLMKSILTGKWFSITVIQVYAPTTNAKEAEVEWFYEDLQELLEPSRTSRTKKRCPSHHRGLKCKIRKSRDIWSNRKVWPWSTKWSRAKLTEFCQENALIIANMLFQ